MLLEEARVHTQAAKDLLPDITSKFLTVSRILAAVVASGAYKGMGYETPELYFENAIRLKERKAWYFVQLGRVVWSRDISDVDVEGVGWSKAKEIGQAPQEFHRSLIEFSKNHNVQEVKNEISRLRGQNQAKARRSFTLDIADAGRLDHVLSLLGPDRAESLMAMVEDWLSRSQQDGG